MKKIESDCDYGTFRVAERDDCSLALAADSSGKLREVGLFEVTVTSARTIHILARNERDARSQAECVSRGNSGDDPPVSYVAKSIPFGIRGWGETLFSAEK